MTMSIGSKIGFTIFTLGFLLNYVETVYFGWNYKAISAPERIVDNITTVMILLGFCMLWYYKSKTT